MVSAGHPHYHQQVVVPPLTLANSWQRELMISPALIARLTGNQLSVLTLQTLVITSLFGSKAVFVCSFSFLASWFISRSEKIALQFWHFDVAYNKINSYPYQKAYILLNKMFICVVTVSRAWPEYWSADIIGFSISVLTSMLCYMHWDEKVVFYIIMQKKILGSFIMVKFHVKFPVRL